MRDRALPYGRDPKRAATLAAPRAWPPAAARAASRAGAAVQHRMTDFTLVAPPATAGPTRGPDRPSSPPGRGAGGFAPIQLACGFPGCTDPNCNDQKNHAGTSHYTTTPGGKLKSHGQGAERNVSVNEAQTRNRLRRLGSSVQNAQANRQAQAQAPAGKKKKNKPAAKPKFGKPPSKTKK